MTTIRKTANDWKVDPNFSNYEQTRATFDRSMVPDPCAGMPSGGCDIAYAAVDRTIQHVRALKVKVSITPSDRQR
ncbi:hypothetical protein AB4Z42_08395 [Mycobacterium sp. 2YAF39]|uniref:hypothetical protein n=1 Tax=Mycobacterium sp. 2YAF39 TaxID=3233033 RepID=UPI003F9D8B50